MSPLIAPFIMAANFVQSVPAEELFTKDNLNDITNEITTDCFSIPGYCSINYKDIPLTQMSYTDTYNLYMLANMVMAQMNTMPQIQIPKGEASEHLIENLPHYQSGALDTEGHETLENNPDYMWAYRI